MNTKTVIKATGIATPPFVLSQEACDTIMAEYFREELSVRSLEVLHKVLQHKSVRTRHMAVQDMGELLTVKNEDPDCRIARFTEWSIRLAAEALGQALSRAGLSAGAVTALIVNTCTGYLCPGIATYLIERMGMRRTIPVYDLVGSGCGGAIPNIQLADRIVRSDAAEIVACVSVEISTATFEMDNDMGLLVSNAIFADGAAAAIVCSASRGLSLEATASGYYPELREAVRFVHRKGRLQNQLDAQLPKEIRKTVPPFIRSLLAQRNLVPESVRHWALHPGGDRIIGAIQEELNLTEDDLTHTRDILSRYGNMSSPTVLFVLDALMKQGLDHDAWCMMVAYGAGMSIHGYLMKNSA
jgi:predicted naringenin-chalcone synthase